MSIINIAAYKFTALADPADLRIAFKTRCDALGLKGTILLSPEGINLFLAGEPADIEAFKAFLADDARFQGMVYKESQSAAQPFRYMRVKLKKEIITMGHPEISPATSPAPVMTPEEFKRWLDEGREVVVLDTRNDYEMKVGTFKNAIGLNIQHFRQFPEAARTIDPALRDKPVVSFCTGGIRCEKAAPWLLNLGFKEVYQLEGGILNYFEKVGGAHYTGECFVFDQRGAVDAALAETGVAQCGRCMEPLTAADQQSSLYIPGRACPHCSAEATAHQAPDRQP